MTGARQGTIKAIIHYHDRSGYVNGRPFSIPMSDTPPMPISLNEKLWTVIRSKKFKFHAFPFLRGWHKLWLQTTLWIIELRFGFGLRGRLKDVPWFCTSLPSHRFRKKYIHLRNVFLGYFGMKILKQPQSKIWNIFPRYEFTWEHSFRKKQKFSSSWLLETIR